MPRSNASPVPAAELRRLASGLLVPYPNNFTSPERTPWGGTAILEYKRDLKITDAPAIVGESWEISAHPGFPNYFPINHDGLQMDVSLPQIESQAADLLYGDPHRHLPFIVKLLDANDWLSVQVHPRSDAPGLRAEEQSKTEAWLILRASPDAAIYLGLQDGVAREHFATCAHAGREVLTLLNHVPVKAGDVFLVPAGTPHAIGPGILLLEVQEPSDTTYRIYDFGRRDVQGHPRLLHIDEALTSIQWADARGGALVASLRRHPKTIRQNDGLKVDSLLTEPEFSLRRITLQSGSLYRVPSATTISGFTVLAGAVVLEKWAHDAIGQGRSFLIPHAFNQDVSIQCLPGTPVVLIETSA